MALNFHLAPSRRSQGFTLLELLTAMAVTGIIALLAFAAIRMYWAQSIPFKKDSERTFRAQVLLQSLAANIRSGRGIVSLGADEIILLNSSGARMHYQVRDSLLYINAVPQDFPVSGWEIQAWGPQRPSMAWEDQSNWSLDSLDANRNGMVDFSELDTDFDGLLTDSECRLLGRISIRLEIMGESGRTLPLAVTVHPRNRL